MARITSSVVSAPVGGTVLFDTGALSAGVVEIKKLIVTVDGPANIRLEWRDSTNTVTNESYTFVVSQSSQGIDLEGFSITLAASERLRLVVLDSISGAIQASMSYRVYQRLVLSQGGAGTVTIAAVTGQKHKVLGFILSLANDGTFRFESPAATLLTGNIKVDGQLQPVVMGPSEISICEGAAGALLQIVTTQAGQGVIIYTTEA